MKYLILSDTHFGISSFNKNRFEYMISYFTQEVFPLILSKKIKHVFHLGDIVDKRNVIDFYIDNGIKNRFIQWFEDNKVHLYLIVGNHDMYYKNERAINYSSLNFKGRYRYIHVIDEITKIKIGKVQFLLVPWILNDLEAEQIKDIEADVCFGHFEINGVKLNSSVEITTGLSQKIFKNYKLTLSGHIHNQQWVSKNILYVGTPYQLMWSDYGERKGVWIMDDKLNLEFVENKVSPRFVKIFCYKDKFVVDKKEFYDIDDLRHIIQNNFFKFIIIEQRDDLEDVYSFIEENANLKYEIISEEEVKAYQVLNEEVEFKLKSFDEIILEALDKMQLEDERKMKIATTLLNTMKEIQKGMVNAI